MIRLGYLMTKIFVAGHRGMVGSAICRKLQKRGEDVITSSRSDLDLLNQSAVRSFFDKNQIDTVYLAAAKVGGIYANDTYPAEFIYENLMIQNNVIHSAFKSGVKKLLFLGSSCIYPKLAKQPISEHELLNGYLEPTNEPYALAKIAGIKMCESYSRQYNVDYRSVMPSNLYGPGDNYNLQNSHVIPGLIRKFHQAKINREGEVQAWGTGNVFREFLYIEDLAEASIFVANLAFDQFRKISSERCTHINVGSGDEISIKKLAELVSLTVGFEGIVSWDYSKPDGSPRKIMDSNAIRSLGWIPKTSLKDGLKLTYEAFLSSDSRL